MDALNWKSAEPKETEIPRKNKRRRHRLDHEWSKVHKQQKGKEPFSVSFHERGLCLYCVWKRKVPKIVCKECTIFKEVRAP